MPTQTEIANHLCMSERNARDVLKGIGEEKGFDDEWWKTTDLGFIRRYYILDLRDKAAGRGGKDQNALTKARTQEAEASAMLKMAQVGERAGLLVPVEELEPLLESWAVTGRSEAINAVEKFIAALESKHGIEIDRELINETFDPAFDAIGGYPCNLDGNAPSRGGKVEATT